MQKLTTKENNLTLRSDEVQELITNNPGWLVRRGNFLLFILLMIILGIFYMIKYPDIVKASLNLTSNNTPKAVISRIEGKLQRLLVSENSNVEKGQILGFMESTANHSNVLGLSGMIDSMNMLIVEDKMEEIPALFQGGFSKLGELQYAYQTFFAQYLELKNSLYNGYYQQKRSILLRDLVNLENLNRNLRKQDSIATLDLALSQKKFEVQDGLTKQKVMAPMDLNTEESKLLLKKLTTSAMEATRLNNNSLQNDKLKELLELNRQIELQKEVFRQSFYSFKSALDDWKTKYLITAPVKGSLNFSITLQENQFIALNQELFYILPDNISLSGDILVPQFNSGKIKEGQKVLIKFVSYPFEEFGSVEGRVSSVGKVPLKDGSYLVKVNFPNGLVTNYNKTLTYKTGMIAEADIITDDSRLISKLLYNFRKLFAR